MFDPASPVRDLDSRFPRNDLWYLSELIDAAGGADILSRLQPCEPIDYSQLTTGNGSIPDGPVRSSAGNPTRMRTFKLADRGRSDLRRCDPGSPA